jgi:hypothetical protein
LPWEILAQVESPCYTKTALDVDAVK